MAGAPPAVLANVPLFSGLKPRELSRIASAMKERRYSAGETITVEGEEGIGFFVIESGKAAVSVGGDEKRTIGPGDYFGEVALLAGTRRTATITAEEDLTSWGLTSWAFRPIVEENPTIAWELLQAVAKLL
ncbi:MAG: family transcriptional regulator, cyclic receptor protein [Gaiellaceae bacterium]|nr:family transcriptional regulator, cyclic receptor protein [Gaiellaceae bacterium]